MATVEALTDKLLKKNLGIGLPEFIKSQTKMGNDTLGITAALAMATEGEGYDRRTVDKWIDVYR